MSTPKVWMKAGYPAIAAFCARHGMKVANEAQGGRGEWSVRMQSPRFVLSVGEDILPRSVTFGIKASRGLKRSARLDKLLQELGLWEPRDSRLDERALADVLEANLEAVLQHLENGPG